MKLTKQRKLIFFVALATALNTRVYVATSYVDGFYAIKEQTKTLTRQNGEEDESSVKPFKAVSVTECIIKCRIVYGNGFFVEDQQNCYCLREGENKDLSKVATQAEEQVNGKLYKNTKVFCSFLLFFSHTYFPFSSF